MGSVGWPAAFVGTHHDGPGYFSYVNTINNYSAVTAACMMVERAKTGGHRRGGRTSRWSQRRNLCLQIRRSRFYNVYPAQEPNTLRVTGTWGIRT